MPAPSRAPIARSARRGQVAHHSIVLGMTGIASVLLAVGLSHHVETAGTLRRVLVFAHLMSVVVGFGATFAIDIYGLLWIAGRRSASDLRRMITATHVLVWGGVHALSITGAFLSPTLDATRTQVKMLLVVVAIINGAWSVAFLDELHMGDGARETRPSRSMVVRAMVAGAVSQACWWGATAIGFLTTMSRRG